MDTIKLRITQECPPFRAGDIITADADIILDGPFERVDDDAPTTRKVHLLGRAALTGLLDAPSVVVKGTWAHFVSDAARQEMVEYLS